MLGFAPLLAGIAMPALSRARMQALEVQSMSNLRQIGLAAIMYSNDHKGRFPNTLGETLPYLENNPSVFVHPKSGKAAPATAAPAELAKWVDQNSDYVYVGAGVSHKTERTAETVIAHERFELAQGRIAAAFADGHCETMPVDELRRRLASRAAGGSARPEAAPSAPGGRPTPPRITPPPAPPRPTPPAPRPPRAPQPPR
jgi:hypothetical protein